MARKRIEEEPANPNAEAAGEGTSEPAGDADGEVLAKPEKLTPKKARAASAAGLRLCKATATLRRVVDGKDVDVPPGTELELSDDEFRHFQKTGCVAEVF